MADKAWKQMERRIAGFFGALRVPGSGSMGRRDLSRSDSTHERLFIECKALQRFSVLNIWREAAKHAAAEGKLPVVALHALSRKEAGGDFLLIRTEDFDAVAAERKKFLQSLVAETCQTAEIPPQLSLTQSQFAPESSDGQG